MYDVFDGWPQQNLKKKKQGGEPPELMEEQKEQSSTASRFLRFRIPFATSRMSQFRKHATMTLQ